MSLNNQKTFYGVAVVLEKNKQLYLSRRSENMAIFPKKWQFVNGRLGGSEISIKSGIRHVEEQTGIKLDQGRLVHAALMNIDEINECYYIYLVHLKESETPVNTNQRLRSDWRLFPLESAVVLDVIPCIRDIIKKLNKNLIKFETMQKLKDDLEEEQKIRKLAQLVHKMTRLV